MAWVAWIKASGLSLIQLFNFRVQIIKLVMGLVLMEFSLDPPQDHLPPENPQLDRENLETRYSFKDWMDSRCRISSLNIKLILYSHCLVGCKERWPRSSESESRFR